jgi:hypothetical protein
MNTKERPEIFSRVENQGRPKQESTLKHSMNAKLIFSLSWLAAVTLIASPVNAGPRRGGGGHGHGHMSMPSRGGATFSRGGNRSGRNWNGRNWSGGNQFIFTGGFGSPYYGYGSYPYGYYNQPAYGYGYYGNQGYGYGNGNQGYGYYGNQGYGYGNGNQGYRYSNGNQGYRYGNQRQAQKAQIRERSRRDQQGR